MTKWLLEKFLLVVFFYIISKTIVFQLIGMVPLMVITYGLAFFITLKITNQRGYAIFYEQEVIFIEGKKQKVVHYDEISKIYKRKIDTIRQNTELKHFGPCYNEYVITTAKDKIILRNSAFEVCKKAKLKELLYTQKIKPQGSVDEIIEILKNKENEECYK